MNLAMHNYAARIVSAVTLLFGIREKYLAGKNHSSCIQKFFYRFLEGTFWLSYVNLKTGG